ncbi:suppressor of SWI4 1 homolog [Physella acuta]|uniref:suppressor of SWI4 1 homolog n=1 Tax=Physella acuta TaxID=109671 RepID=UPI0027DEA30D|nr:suppressor of SWI4 1 homolog [Physella acuta]
MEPYTASNLRVRKKNVMKDCLTIAGPLQVSHFIVFTKTDIATYMKLVCVPRGPTLTFKVNEFSLSKDVLSFQKHPDVDSKLFTNNAVMVANIPSDSMENKLMNITFKNMFPSINPNTVKLNNMRRSVLVNYDPESKTVDIRHYIIKVTPTGVSKAMKKLMRSKLPDLGHHEDIADLFMEKGMSDSEGEQDGPHNQVTVTQNVKGRGVTRNAVNAIRVKEIGPRLNLTLIKIEEDFEDGDVLYHLLVVKTPEELEAIKAMRIQKQKEKLARKQKQEADVRKKQKLKEEHIKKTEEGMKRKMKEKGETETVEEEDSSEVDNKAENEEEDVKNEDDDDDREYYKQEIGEEPEPEMFSSSRKRKRGSQDSVAPQAKRAKQGKNDFKQGKKDFKQGKRDFKQVKEDFKKGHNQGRGETNQKHQKENRFSGASGNKKSKFSVKFQQKDKFDGKQKGRKDGNKKKRPVRNKVKKPVFRPKETESDSRNLDNYCFISMFSIYSIDKILNKLN